jgi:uncharacterized protein
VIDAAPVSTQERVQVLDVLRGCAILGMWIVNMTIDVPWDYRVELMPMEASDSAVAVVGNLFLSGKFFTIFSFLFGVGVFVQIERVRARGTNHVTFYMRRSLGLLLIAYAAIAGTTHPWILVDYAVLGLTLLLFVGRSPRLILRAAIVCFALTLVFDNILPGVEEFTELQAYADEQDIPLEAAIAAQGESEAARGIAREPGIRSATFLQSSKRFLSHALRAHSSWSYYLERLGTLGLMLLGLYVARRGAVWDQEVRRTIARRALPWLIGMGAVFTVVAVAMKDSGLGNESSLAQRILWATLQDPVGATLLGLGYAALLVLLFDRGAWRRWLARLAPVGRMALTCYLLTQFLSSFISFGWGLGRFGDMMPFEGFLIVVLASPLLIIACTWWLERFRFGPVEWLWRSFTYGRPQRMRLRP